MVLYNYIVNKLTIKNCIKFTKLHNLATKNTIIVGFTGKMMNKLL